jgi:hypothetical protein
MTTTEVRRTRFYGNLDGRWHVGPDRRTDIGPAIVEVVIWHHEDSTGRKIEDSFSVVVDGEHQWGGFARHLGKNGSPLGLERLRAVRADLETVPHTHIRSFWSRCELCGADGFYAGPTSAPSATQALANMLRGKVREAMANGATEDEAIAAVRALWLEALEARR